MKTIVLIACSATKLTHRAKARELYTGDLFQKSLAYAEALRPDAIYILSAKHHLVELDRVIGPTNCSLKDLRLAERRAWAEQVLRELRARADLDNDHFVFLAGKTYRELLEVEMVSHEDPLKGLKIDEQVDRLKKLLGGVRKERTP